MNYFVNKDGELFQHCEELGKDAWIRFEEINPDYSSYLEWLELGNTPIEVSDTPRDVL